MTISASAGWRVSALVLAAGLTLSACGDDQTAETPPNRHELEAPEAPDVTAQETGLVETLEADFEVSKTMTLEDQWPDITAMASALAGTSNPDLCQQAGAEQYQLLVDAEPPSVRATIASDALLDEQAAGETVTVFYATEDASAQRLHDVHEATDTACVEEYESAIEHETSTATVGEDTVEVQTWQVVATEQLTGRMIDVIGDDIFVRYAASYPPQVIAADLDAEAATEFKTAATERALQVYEAAAAQ